MPLDRPPCFLKLSLLLYDLILQQKEGNVNRKFENFKIKFENLKYCKRLSRESCLKG